MNSKEIIEKIGIYLKILQEVKVGKIEIFEYIFKRLFGIRTRFSKDVFIESNDCLFNCGRLMDHCVVACSRFEPYINNVIDLKSGTFIDVGANIGKHTIITAKKLGKKGRVISIEADSENIDLLKNNIKINECENVEIHNIACFNKKGTVEFYRSEFNPSISSIYNKKDRIKTLCPSDTLDNLAIKYKDIKIIKIDVEGAELEVLEGTKKIIIRNHPTIIFEAQNNKTLNKIKKFLKKFDYKIKRLAQDNYLAEKK